MEKFDYAYIRFNDVKDILYDTTYIKNNFETIGIINIQDYNDLIIHTPILATNAYEAYEKILTKIGGSHDQLIAVSEYTTLLGCPEPFDDKLMKAKISIVETNNVTFNFNMVKFGAVWLYFHNIKYLLTNCRAKEPVMGTFIFPHNLYGGIKELTVDKEEKDGKINLKLE